MTRRANLGVLRRARERIAHHNRWTQGTLAADVLNHGVDPKSPEAAAWCALGAIHAEIQSARSRGAPDIPKASGLTVCEGVLPELARLPWPASAEEARSLAASLPQELYDAARLGAVDRLRALVDAALAEAQP